MAIPKTAHFIWYGQRFPWVNLLALRSAVVRGGFERIVLHHDGGVTPSHLTGLPGLAGVVELRPITAEHHFDGLGSARGKPLAALHDALHSPAAKANIVRMCVLAQEGGVYLDVDTVTVASLAPLLKGGGVFCGCERIAFPAALFRSRNPVRWSVALGLSALRFGLRELPGGFRYFPHVAGLYPTAVNNAVVGAEPFDPFVLGMLDAMLAMPRARRRRRYALGTHLLQAKVAEHVGPGLTVHPPEVFFPLPPEICLHWFREGPAPNLSEAIGPTTRVVHWYASNRNQALTDRLDAEYVRAHRDRQLFSALAAEFL